MHIFFIEKRDKSRLLPILVESIENDPSTSFSSQMFNPIVHAIIKVWDVG